MSKAASQLQFERAAKLLGATLALAALLVGTAYSFRASALAAQARAQSDLQSVEYNISVAQERQGILLEYQDDFLQLLAGGVVGEERRLNWIEALKANGIEYRIPKIQYRIDSRSFEDPETFGFMAESSELPVIYRSRMELELEMLHEAEILALLDALGKDAQGLFTINSCDVSRSAEELLWDLNPNFSGKCALDWYTIKRPVPVKDVM